MVSEMALKWHFKLKISIYSHCVSRSSDPCVRSLPISTCDGRAFERSKTLSNQIMMRLEMVFIDPGVLEMFSTRTSRSHKDRCRWFADLKFCKSWWISHSLIVLVRFCFHPNFWTFEVVSQWIEWIAGRPLLGVAIEGCWSACWPSDSAECYWKSHFEVHKSAAKARQFGRFRAVTTVTSI